MAFSNMQGDQKDAFFALLDEYFASRPAIFANLNSGPATSSTQTPEREAAAAVHRAMVNNPEATSKVMSAGFRHLANSRASNGGAGGSEPSAGGSDNEPASVASRVAAASSAFSASRNRPIAASASAGSPPPVAQKPASGLTQVKKFGNLDTSSTMGFLGSAMRNKPKSPPQPMQAPSAFAPKTNSFAPPPRRTVSTETSAVTSPPPPPAPLVKRQASPEPEPEETGEWASVLYDYSSAEATDLQLEEGQRVLVVERTSDDWWTGEINGKKGLFPASYVKLV